MFREDPTYATDMLVRRAYMTTERRYHRFIGRPIKHTRDAADVVASLKHVYSDGRTIMASAADIALVKAWNEDRVKAWWAWHNTRCVPCHCRERFGRPDPTRPDPTRPGVT